MTATCRRPPPWSSPIPDLASFAWGLAALVMLGVAACSGDPGETATDASASSTSTGEGTGSTGEATETETETDAETDACGPPPAAPACAPDVPSDPRTAICAGRSESECDGPIEAGSTDECRWVSVQTFAAGATTCAAPTTSGACVAFAYYGDGCVLPSACDIDTEGYVYFRTNEACETELFRRFTCGTAAVDWGACYWDARETEACPQPWPTVGPALCRCAC